MANLVGLFRTFILKFFFIIFLNTKFPCSVDVKVFINSIYCPHKVFGGYWRCRR